MQSNKLTEGEIYRIPFGRAIFGFDGTIPKWGRFINDDDLLLVLSATNRIVCVVTPTERLFAIMPFQVDPFDFVHFSP